MQCKSIKHALSLKGRCEFCEVAFPVLSLVSNGMETYEVTMGILDVNQPYHK